MKSTLPVECENQKTESEMSLLLGSVTGFSKLSVGSKNVLLELSLFKPEDEMDHETF